MVHGKLWQHAAQRVAEGSRLWLAHQSTIPEASTLEVGQLSELGARVAAMVLGALLPIGVKAGDTTRLCHGAGGGAATVACPDGRPEGRDGEVPKGVPTEKCE